MIDRAMDKTHSVLRTGSNTIARVSQAIANLHDITRWASLATLLLVSQSAQAVFSTPGQFSVGQDGSANYSIPIVDPPGTAGMAPKLSLNYSSNGGNGILGMGWGLSGLSQIGRCPKTSVSRILCKRGLG